jgi:hypothetical protein
VQSVTYKAALAANRLIAPGAGGTIRVTNGGPAVSLTGDIINVAALAGSWVDLVIDGTIVQSSPIFPAVSVAFPGGTLFRVEPFRAALAPTAPLTRALTGAHAGSTAVVQVTNSLQPIGSLITIPKSPIAGAVVAQGVFR